MSLNACQKAIIIFLTCTFCIECHLHLRLYMAEQRRSLDAFEKLKDNYRYILQTNTTGLFTRLDCVCFLESSIFDSRIVGNLKHITDSFKFYK